MSRLAWDVVHAVGGEDGGRTADGVSWEIVSGGARLRRAWCLRVGGDGSRDGVVASHFAAISSLTSEMRGIDLSVERS